MVIGYWLEVSDFFSFLPMEGELEAVVYIFIMAYYHSASSKPMFPR